MIPGDLLSAFPHRQFHTLPGLLDSWAALPNSYPNALRAMQGGSLYHFYDGLFYVPTDRQTDRNVYLTKINKIHKIIFRKNCGRETSTKTIYSRSRGGHPVTYHNS